MLKKKLVSLLALALSSMMLLSACVGNADGDTQGGNGGEGTQTNASGEVVKDANELVIGTYMPVTTLVPWKTTSDGDGYILRQIYHTLVEMDEQSNFVPSLVKWLQGDLLLGSWVKTMLVGNVLMFVPMGIFLPLTFPRLSRQKLWLSAIIVPIIIEIIQPIVGRSFDIDDLICNSIGILIGYLAAHFMKKAMH